MHDVRVGKLQKQLEQWEIDALALIPGPSLYYLTNISFHLMERPVIGFFPAAGEPFLFLPEFEAIKANTSPINLGTFTYGEDPSTQVKTLAQALRSANLAAGATIGVEPLNFRYFESQLISQAAPETNLASAEQVITPLRATKDQSEIVAMEIAVQMAEAALRETIPLIRMGMTESELSAELVIQLLRQGSEDELPFQPIVASGPNSAIPHYSTGQRELRPGEFLLIDWGARRQGYCSDLTRTFALKEADNEMRAIYQAVLNANKIGRQTAAPEIACGTVDRAARSRIEEAGYGPHFKHRLGHGLGLEPHEHPYIYSENEEELKVGMAFTVEPGVYLSGKGGVRIEDDVIITQSGSRSLSQFPRELQVIA